MLLHQAAIHTTRDEEKYLEQFPGTGELPCLPKRATDLTMQDDHIYGLIVCPDPDAHIYVHEEAVDREWLGAG